MAQEMLEIEKFTYLVVGGKHSGKSSLIKRFVEDTFTPTSNTMSTHDNNDEATSKQIRLENNAKAEISIWETPTKARQFDAVFITFDLSNVESFKKLDEHLKELSKLCPHCNPEIIIVGTKSDQTTGNKEASNALSLKARARRYKYYATSALNGENASAVFTEAAERLTVVRASQIAKEEAAERQYIPPQNPGEAKSVIAAIYQAIKDDLDRVDSTIKMGFWGSRKLIDEDGQVQQVHTSARNIYRLCEKALDEKNPLTCADACLKINKIVSETELMKKKTIWTKLMKFIRTLLQAIGIGPDKVKRAQLDTFYRGIYQDLRADPTSSMS